MARDCVTKINKQTNQHKSKDFNISLLNLNKRSYVLFVVVNFRLLPGKNIPLIIYSQRRMNIFVSTNPSQ